MKAICDVLAREPQPARFLEFCKAHGDGKLPWWREEDVKRTFAFQALVIYTNKIQPPLTVGAVLRDPVAYDTLLQHWQMCERCCETKAKTCLLAALDSFRAYAVLVQYDGGIREIALRSCRGHDLRQQEIDEAYGRFKHIGGGMKAVAVEEEVPW